MDDAREVLHDVVLAHVPVSSLCSKGETQQNI